MRQARTVLNKAVRFASLKHGQAVDKAGQPFIGHPMRVMARLAVDQHPDEVLAAAALHDVLEDTGTDPLEMQQEVGTWITELVLDLTRTDEEAYFDYIRRVKENPIAVCVKLADLADNLNPVRRVPGLKLPQRYERAVRILRGEES